MKCEGPAAVVAEGGPGREEGTSHARRPLRERELLCGQVGRELRPCLPHYPSWERHVPCSLCLSFPLLSLFPSYPCDSSPICLFPTRIYLSKS